MAKTNYTGNDAEKFTVPQNPEPPQQELAMPVDLAQFIAAESDAGESGEKHSNNTAT